MRCICAHLNLVPTYTYTRTHNCVVTGWALGLLKVSARAGREIAYPPTVRQCANSGFVGRKYLYAYCCPDCFCIVEKSVQGGWKYTNASATVGTWDQDEKGRLKWLRWAVRPEAAWGRRSVTWRKSRTVIGQESADVIRANDLRLTTREISVSTSYRSQAAWVRVVCSIGQLPPPQTHTTETFIKDPLWLTHLYALRRINIITKANSNTNIGLAQNPERQRQTESKKEKT